MPSPFTAASIVLSRAVDGAYGELFEFQAFITSDDVNKGRVADITRQTFVVIGTFHGAFISVEPRARGAIQDDYAHSIVASRPQVSVEDVALIWLPKMGDRLLRLADGSVYEIASVLPEKARRTLFELTARK